jgi:hypothetical protein
MILATILFIIILIVITDQLNVNQPKLTPAIKKLFGKFCTAKFIIKLSNLSLTWGYVENYSEEVFTVIERVPRVPPVYRLKEENGREMDSFYYEQELLAINKDPDPFNLIERILERRGNRVLVKWLGYPDYYNQ